MNIESYRAYCLAKKGVTEEFPFDATTLVFKVMGKMFALTDLEKFDGINLKVKPEVGVLLREQYEFVRPGYHMDKKHWITVAMEGNVPDRLLKPWIDESYNLVVESLSRSQKLTLGGL